MSPKEFATKWFSAIDAKNFDGLKSMMASNHRFANRVIPAPLGAQEHLGIIQQMVGAFTGGHTPELMICEGDWIVTHGRWTGKPTGDFNGMPATGNTVDFTFSDIMHVVDGKLAEEFMEWNFMTLMTQIGAMPQPA